jgi:predicted dehydrogenase
MSENFRWGVIGPGRIAGQFAADMQVVEGAEIYAVASRSGAEKFVHDFEIPVVYGSYEALVQDPKVDGIYIATPHNFHFENAQMCLQAGKAVLCEKPLTVNARQAQSLIQLSHENRVFLMEALWTRYLPLYTEVRKLLDEEVIGEVVAMQSTFCFKSIKDEKERWLNPDLAGGTLLDLGIYPISVSQWVMGGNPVEVQSQAVLDSTGVDIVLAANLQYSTGAVSQFTTSFIHKARNDFTIYGTRGKIILDEPFWGGTKGVVSAGPRHLDLEKPFRSHGFEYEIEEAVRCIREGRLESPSMTHADSLANIQLMDTIREQVGVKYPFE